MKCLMLLLLNQWLEDLFAFILIIANIDRISHGHPGGGDVKFRRNPICGLVRARREAVRKNTSRFVHLRFVDLLRG